MAYAVTADVQSTLVNIGPFTTTSKPTEAEVLVFVVLVSAEMDAVFASAGITVRVMESTKLPLLKKICCDGTAAMVLRSIQVESEQAAAFEKIYRDALKNIRENPAVIESVTGSGTGGYITGPDNSAAERHFTREGREW